MIAGRQARAAAKRGGRRPLGLIGKATAGQPGTGVNPGRIVANYAVRAILPALKARLGPFSSGLPAASVGPARAGRETLRAKRPADHERRGGVLLHHITLVK
jgi:hypothetical protein